MDMQKDIKAVEAFGYSLALVCLLSALLVILKEKSEPVMALMKAVTPHHWITHGMVVLITFFVFGLMFTKVLPQHSDAEGFNRVAGTILASTIVSGLVLAAFFLFGT